MAAGTLVVYRDPSPDQERIPEQRPLAPSQPLSLAEQQLVLDFCSREADLPGERAAELAALVPALTKTYFTNKIFGLSACRTVADSYRRYFICLYKRNQLAVCFVCFVHGRMRIYRFVM